MQEGIAGQAIGLRVAGRIERLHTVAGDRVAVYGLLETAEPDAYDILLVGSKQYYIKQVTS